MSPKYEEQQNQNLPQQESTLLEGILSEARDEAQKLIDEATAQAKKKKAAAESQSRSILEDAQRRAGEQRAAIMKSAESSTAAEVRRITLRGREALFDKVITRLKEEIAALSRGEEYASILKGWIIEAVLGLGTADGLIEAPERERSIITPAFLKDAAGEIQKLSGREVTLSLAETKAVGGPGIIVYNKERTLAFDNRLEARISRCRRDLIRIVSDDLDLAEEK
jgi:V/A-type H+/Na+-transporting ATPase subunit E